MTKRVLQPRQVLEQTERVVASNGFKSSPKLKSFLRFIVNEKLDGNADRLKAYSIATQAFGRPVDFNPDIDPIVRVQAAKLRNRLNIYNLTTGKSDPIRITLPKGGYVPIFEINEVVTVRDKVVGDDDTENTDTILFFPDNADEVSDQKLRAAIMPDRGVPVLAICNCEAVDIGQWQREFCGGLVEELSLAFSRFCDINFLPPSLTSTNNHLAMYPLEFGRTVGADFVLIGNIRGDKKRARLSMKLLDVDTGRFIWTKRCDITNVSKNMINLQEAIAGHVASVCASPFGYMHADKLWSLGTGKISPQSAYDHVLLTLAYHLRPNAESFSRAIKSAEKAVELAPNWGMASAMLAILHVFGYLIGYENGSTSSPSLDTGYKIAFDSVKRLPSSGYGRLALSVVLFALGGKKEAIIKGEESLAINPNNSVLKLTYGNFRALSGDWDEAISILESAVVGDVENVPVLDMINALIAYKDGNYSEALGLFSVREEAGYHLYHMHRAMCLGQLGRKTEALAEIDKLLQVKNDFTIEQANTILTKLYQPALARHCLEGLRLAGLEKQSIVQANHPESTQSSNIA